MVTECPDCGSVLRSGACPECGWKVPPLGTAPIRTVRQPTCYGCGVVLPHPGYCGNCLGQTERELAEFAARHSLPVHPVNGDVGIYNGSKRVWVNGYWIAPSCAPDWIHARIARKAIPKLTPEKQAELAQEHAQVRAKLPELFGMDGKPLKDETPF